MDVEKFELQSCIVSLWKALGLFYSLLLIIFQGFPGKSPKIPEIWGWGRGCILQEDQGYIGDGGSQNLGGLWGKCPENCQISEGGRR